MNKDFSEDALARVIREAGGEDCRSPEHRDRLRRQVLEAFDRAVALQQSTPLLVRTRPNWRWIVSRPVPRYAALALVAVTFLATLWMLFGAKQQLAFADLIQPILDAKTATFKSTVNRKGKPPSSNKVLVSGNRLRSESPSGIINVIDVSEGQSIWLSPTLKTATVVQSKNRPQGAMSPNWLDKFRDTLRHAERDENITAESLGEKQVDGQRAIGFRITADIGEEWTLWMNPELRLPVRIEIWSSVNPDTTTTMSDFQFDVELDESLFSLTPPEGYKVERREHDMSPLTEEDFLVALRWASEIRDGKFPDALTTEDYCRIILAYNRKWKQEQKPGEQNSPTRFDSGRGFNYPHLLPLSTEPHYAGKGVSLGEKDHPIFWHRPVDSDKWSVIYADLTVRDENKAPDVPGAERIGASKKPSQE